MLCIDVNDLYNYNIIVSTEFHDDMHEVVHNTSAKNILWKNGEG